METDEAEGGGILRLLSLALLLAVVSGEAAKAQS